MALNKSTLKNTIAAIMTEMMERENTSIEEFATRLSDAIDDYVKDADIKYTAGLVTAIGPVTGVFQGNLI